MSDRPPITETTPSTPESYARLLANLASVFAAVVVLLVLVLSPRPRPQPTPIVAQPPRPEPAKQSRAASQRKEPPPRVVPDAPPVPDRAAIARAEAVLDAARRDRSRADARALDAARALDQATKQVASDTASGRMLGSQLRDPSAQIARASTRGGFLKADRDRLKEEVVALRKAPRPKAKQLAGQNPVARPAGGDEYHFELRRNRVTFIDLDRLMALVKADAQVRIRLNDSSRGVESRVGPVGSFALEYVMGRALPNGVEELMERRGISFNLRGWELIPEFEGRGETYEMTRSPASQFSRAVNRLNPSHSTITMWIYPDGFPLYRKLRDALHARGYLVAARPLPEGVSIRGSPAGSTSAGQ